MLPNPVISFNIGSWPINIYMYGIMCAAGILSAFIVLSVYCKLLSVDRSFSDFVYYDGIVSVIAGFGFAALFQAIFNYIENPAGGFRIGSGITFIGGLIGGAGCFFLLYFLFKKKLNGRMRDIITIVPCCLTVAHAFGRIGCFCAGCCYGKPTDSFLGVEFPKLPGGPRHPTQLYESLYLFVLFAIFSFLAVKKKYRYNMSLYLMLYGTFRFLIEFLRDDARGKFLGAPPSQLLSVVMVVIGIVLHILAVRADKKTLTADGGTKGNDDRKVKETGCSGAEVTTCVEDSNTTCVKDSKMTCVEDSKTTCVEDSKTTCVEDSKTTCVEDSNTTCVEEVSSTDVAKVRSTDVERVNSTDAETGK